MDFGLQNGLASIIDDKANFPRDFAKDIICGVCELDRLQQKPYRDNRMFGEKVTQVRKAFKEYDWVEE